MKHLLLFFMITVLCSCKRDDDQPTNEINQLPPVTNTGNNTFGCLLDGKAFLPGNGQIPLDCTYQYINGGYHFALQANKRDSDHNLISISLGTNNLEIEEDQTYNLFENNSNNANGVYFFNTFLSYTSQVYTGELTITKLDMQDGIVSGTFWFDVEDHNRVIHQIREGRFDVPFTQ